MRMKITILLTQRLSRLDMLFSRILEHVLGAENLSPAYRLQTVCAVGKNHPPRTRDVVFTSPISEGIQTLSDGLECS